MPLTTVGDDWTLPPVWNAQRSNAFDAFSAYTLPSSLPKYTNESTIVGEELIVPPVLNDHCSLPASSCAAALVLLVVTPLMTPAVTAVDCSTRRRVSVGVDFSVEFIFPLFIIMWQADGIEKNYEQIIIISDFEISSTAFVSTSIL
jgi:hypothetical protein